MKPKSLMEIWGEYEEWHYNEFEKDIEKNKWKKKRVKMAKDRWKFQY